MKPPAVALATALLVLTGCGSDDSPKEPDATTAEATPSPTPSATPTVVAPEDLVVTPGAVGPAKVGMSKDDAAATGLFDVDVPPPVDGCPPYPLQWKKEYQGLDVLTGDNEEIVSIGVSKGGPRTGQGVGHGSTYSEVKKAYPDLSPVEERGHVQVGAHVSSGDGFIGFLFGNVNDPSAIKGSSKVTFVEVTSGTKPDLIRSCC